MINIIIHNVDKGVSWDWGALIECGVLIAMLIGLFLTGYFYFCDNKEKKSKFYLEQARHYLNNATSLLKDGNNDNIQWHQAIKSLRIADNLKKEITSEAHQHIYFTDYLDVAYALSNIIKKTDNFKFFYGIKNYDMSADTLSLYRQSVPSIPDAPHLRVSPNALEYLLRFFEKINKAHTEDEIAGKPWKEIFDSPYFQEPLNLQTFKLNYRNLPKFILII